MTPSIKETVERLKFDSARCEATFSKGVASNIDEAIALIERLAGALEKSLYYVAKYEAENMSNEALAVYTEARAALSGTEPTP